jgi:signal transduction histidine kinase
MAALAAVLREKKTVILNLWVERVRKALPAAQQADTPALLNHLPLFIDELARTLEASNPPEHARKNAEISKEHGIQRALSPQYSLEQVIQEYGFLHEAIFEVLENEAGTLPTNARDTICNSIIRSISKASSEFVKVQDQLREQFLAILTHDLRNPIAAAKISAQMILRQPKQAYSVERFATRIIDGLHRVENMIRDLLDTYRIRAGQRLPIEVAECDIHEIASHAVDELGTIHGPRFRLEDGESLKGFWDAEGLRRAIETLANNAVKYGDPNTPITISLRQDSGEVCISVHNYGNPIVAEEQAALFSPFIRAPGAETGGKKGWGLGLTLVRGMAESHGGRVIVQSSADGGTTFTMHLPKDARAVQAKVR